LEESYQLLIPSRTASLADLAADIFGALFAIALCNRLFSHQWKNDGSKELPPC
jgi:VanZ family protein